MTPNILPTIFTATGNYTPAVIKMTEATAGLGLASKNASKSMGMLSISQKGVGLTGFQFIRGSMGVLALATAMTLAGKEAMDFGQQMGNVATLVDTNIENIDQMGASVMKLGKVIPKPISDMTEGLYYVRSAGIDAAHAMDVLKESGILATAGLSTVTDAAKAETSAMITFKNQNLTAEQIANSFFLTVKEGKTKMDALNESFGSTAFIAANAGVKLQEFNAATAALTNTGLTASESQVALRGSILAMFKPTGEMIDLLESMGYTGSDAGQKLIAKMGGLVPAMLAVKDAATKTGLNINKAFGRVQGLTALAALTGNQLEQFRKFYKEQMEGEDALSEAFGKQTKQSAAQFQVFKNGVTQLGVRIGNTLLPALNSLLRVLNPIFDGFASFAENHKIASQIIILGGSFLLLNKSLGLLRAGMIAYNFVNTLAAIKTGTLTAQMSLLPGAAAAGKVAMMGFAGSLQAVATKTNILLGGLSLIIAYHQEIADWSNGSSLGMAYNRFIGDRQAVKEGIFARYKKNPEETRKYISEHPDMANSPTILNGLKDIDRTNTLDSLYRVQQRASEDTLLNQSQNKPVGSTYDMPFIPSSGASDKSKTDELLGKIYEVLKNNPNAGMQPAYAQNGQSAKRVPQTIYSTFGNS